MSGIKHAIIDILVTLLIVAAVALDLSWARWIVIIYTPLMIVLKLLAVMGPGINMLKGSRQEPPPWLLHVLYATNVVVLAAGALWYLAAGWLVIWILSIIQDRRRTK